MPASPGGARVVDRARFPIGRIVGIGVVGLAGMAGLMLGVAIAISEPETTGVHEGWIFGRWPFLYDDYVPPLRVLVAAVAFALVFFATAVIVEQVVTNRYRRSTDAVGTPLAPRIVMAETRGGYQGPITITMLVPAHNEEVRIAGTIAALHAQDQAPERIIVVADNCSDSTTDIARAAGVEVFETRDNRDKKAGGLNQILRELLPTLAENDIVMVVDADTALDQGFLAEARQRIH